MDADIPLWTPSPTDIKSSNLTHFQNFLTKQKLISTPFSNYSDLHHWSTAHRGPFWTSLFDYFDILHKGDLTPAELPNDEMINSQWFPSVRLNFAENLLRTESDDIAVVSILENGQRSTLTFRELKEKVRQLQHSLVKINIQPGDRVAAFMPNVAETLVAMLATTSLGAIWSSCSPEFGINGVIDRFIQIEAKVLIACDGYYYNGKTVDCRPKLIEITQRLPHLEQIILVPVIDTHVETGSLNLPAPCSTLEDFLSKDKGYALQFIQLPFNHPLYIMYSSGTTGLPKCIVHGAGGTLLQHLKEHAFHTNLKVSDSLFYYTTCGWMMWNWLVSGLALGVKLVLFDGSPFYPQADRLINLIDEEDITVFGCSAKYLSALEKVGLSPKQN
ncbi:MAG: AMP-binding protein, partial [Gammaproteobacteria bacterium]|nr:AMP-binding protein [Gammaproteobacteria bacterium]